MIDSERFWLAPAFVLGAVYDGQQGFFLTRDHLLEFFRIHLGLPVVMHNAPFDLDVMDTLFTGFDIYELVERDLVWDTKLLHQLLALGTEGHTAARQGQATLEHRFEKYLGCTLPKNIRDSEVREVRLSYGRFLNRPPNEIEPVYLEYLAKDVIATWLLFERLQEQLSSLLSTADQEWGFVSPNWLQQQISRWGPQTHHTQLKSAIVLRAITANGLGIDVERCDELLEQLDQSLEELRTRLRQFGYIPGQNGSEAI